MGISLLSIFRMITQVFLVSLSVWSLSSAQKGSIISENYPDNYPDNVYEKRTTIRASNPDDILQINFIDFKLERVYGYRCYDWLKIQDGDGTVLLDKTCGDNKPRPVTSNTDTVVIIFNSDSYDTEKGFKINWESKPKGGSDECTCGQANEQTTETGVSRISGGAETTPNRFPWMVRIDTGCAGKDCGGALVSPKVVLSAYHCAVPRGYYRPCDLSDGKAFAFVGMHNLWKGDYEDKIPIIKALYPPNAPLRTGWWGDNDSHDFLIYVLKTPAVYTNKVSPICLPQPNAEFGGQKAIAAGWGRTNSSSKLHSQKLKSVELTVSPRRFRHKLMFGTNLEVKNGVYQDPCAGDSGGPLMFYNVTASKYVLIGTVQGGGYNCVTGKVSKFEGGLGVWNKVSAHMDWIQETMNAMGEKLCI